MTKHVAPLPCSEFELEHPCPRHTFPVEALSALHPLQYRWRSESARKTMLDFLGHPINLGDRYYRREIYDGRSHYENLSVPSMNRLLWLIFGLNPELLKFCKATDKARFEEMREGMARAARMFGADSP